MAIETTAGTPVGHGDRVLRPVARVLALRLPGGTGAFVWNRPLGVAVEENGRSRWLRVPDRTRQIQWLILGVGLAAGLLVRRRRRRPRRNTIFRR